MTEGEQPKMSDAIPKLTVETSNNHIYFYSYVDSDRCLALIKSIRDIDSFLRREYTDRELPKNFPFVPIWLHIQSGGGNLFAALALIDQMRKITTPIYSIVEGYTASAATLLSMVCTKRFIQPASFFLIHQLSAATWGTYEQIKDDVHMFDMAMEQLTDFYIEHSNLAKKKIEKLLKRDSWFNAKECLENGFIDEVL